MKIFIVLFLFGVSLNAATLECVSFINLKEVTRSIVQTKANEKVLVDQIDKATSYITEMHPDHYSLEVFIPSLEIRIYSEANLNKSNETIKASIWDRDFMLDVACKKLK